MGWEIGYDSNHKRDVGYGVPATCDHPGCGAEIDRGLSYICGGDMYGGEHGCGLFFCADHLGYAAPEDEDEDEEDYDFDDRCGVQLCERCRCLEPSFDPTPDVPDWIQHKLTDESWTQWREENPEWVKQHAASPSQGA